MAQPSPPPPPDHLRQLVDDLQKLDWQRFESLHETFSQALKLLQDATAAGEANDPSREDSAGVWGTMIQHASPATGVRLARAWYRHLQRHDVRAGAYSKNRGLAAYAAGSLDLQRGNIASARRWLHLAAIEDLRDSHKGAARTVLIESLGEAAGSFDDLQQLVDAAPKSPTDLKGQAEYLLTRWYLMQDVRRSDQSLEGEHDLAGPVLQKFIDNLTASHASTKAAGDALEELAAYLMCHITGCFPVRNASTRDFENDLVVRNLSRHVSPALDILGRYFLVECKNWQDAVGASHLSYFANRVRYGRASFGILFARSGITTGKGTGVDDATFMLHRAYHQDGIVMVVVDQEDLESLAASRESVLQLLLRKHDEVRFGAWSKR